MVFTDSRTKKKYRSYKKLIKGEHIKLRIKIIIIKQTSIKQIPRLE